MAVGGGFELALACDLIVAADHAEFFLPEIAIGIVADAGGVLRLPRRVPRAVAMDLLLTGRRMPAGEALGWGLVNRVVPAGRLLDEARELADVLAQSAPLALAAVKEVVAATEDLDIAAAYAAMWELPAYREMLASDDAREGREAWVQRRPPVWRGR